MFSFLFEQGNVSKCYSWHKLEWSVNAFEENSIQHSFKKNPVYKEILEVFLKNVQYVHVNYFICFLLKKFLIGLSHMKS